MAMRWILLTTQTLHHAAFLRDVAAVCAPAHVLVETTGYPAPYDCHHPFEDVRDAEESAIWFGGDNPALAQYADCSGFDNLNSPAAVARLHELKPDAVVVFGSRRLKPEVISCCPQLMLNLHGGAPEDYRGLDTHLWAIWHGDFGGLATTLHRVNPTLDDGDIVLQGAIPLHQGMKLHSLRRANTAVCTHLVLSALDQIERTGRVMSRPQRRIGRYYSFMPAQIKAVCQRKFEIHTAGLTS